MKPYVTYDYTYCREKNCMTKWWGWSDSKVVKWQPILFLYKIFTMYWIKYELQTTNCLLQLVPSSYYSGL